MTFVTYFHHHSSCSLISCCNSIVKESISTLFSFGAIWLIRLKPNLAMAFLNTYEQMIKCVHLYFKRRTRVASNRTRTHIQARQCSKLTFSHLSPRKASSSIMMGTVCFSISTKYVKSEIVHKDITVHVSTDIVH